ncbi:ATP-binding protein [Natronorarus salvus]|uniref:ATP-binding protein n=1 Tax=Natronorarus salvus TaxID=3117733 RepID=UPI002F267290
MAAIPESITVSDAGYAFPIADLLTGRGAVFGKSGSGKSNTASVLAEELLEYGLPIVVVDIEGEYWGLTERFDVRYAGTTADADFAISIESVDALVSSVLEENEPLVVDVSGISDEETIDAFLSELVSRLFERENRIRKPCLLFVEEIHEFLPQTGRGGAFADVLVTVAKRGRKRGLGLCGLSQRPAAVDKEFITQCDWIAWHRLTWENDTKVVEKILGSEASAPVTTLADGEALVMTDWDEELTRVQFQRKRTFDAGSTPDLSAFEATDIGSPPTDGSGTRRVPGVRPSSPPKERGNDPAGPDTERKQPETPASSADESTQRPPRSRTDQFDPLTEAALLTVYGGSWLRRVLCRSLRRGGSTLRRWVTRDRSP